MFYVNSEFCIVYNNIIISANIPNCLVIIIIYFIVLIKYKKSTCYYKTH